MVRMPRRPRRPAAPTPPPPAPSVPEVAVPEVAETTPAYHNVGPYRVEMVGSREVWVDTRDESKVYTLGTDNKLHPVEVETAPAVAAPPAAPAPAPPAPSAPASAAKGSTLERIADALKKPII